MFFKVGDLVTRKSHDNDIVFKIVEVVDKVAYLKGLNVRLYADSPIDDLKLIEDARVDDNDFIDRVNSSINLDRNEYFYLPGKVLHFDGDNSYVNLIKITFLSLYCKGFVKIYYV